MYERSYGYRYGEVDAYTSCADIAKIIRRDVKQAQQEGLLPAGWSYSVRSESADSASFRKREAERLATKKAARETGEIVGKIANFGRDGRAVVHVVKRTGEGKEVLACGARVSRYGFRQITNNPVTCSRCAKHDQ